MTRRVLFVAGGTLLAMFGTAAVYGLGTGPDEGVGSPTWKLTVVGDHHHRLTRAQWQVIFPVGVISAAGKWPPIQRVHRIIPLDRFLVPALNLVGARLGRRVYARPEPMQTTIHPGLSVRLGRWLPPAGEIIVVNAQGEVVALVGRGTAWRQTIPAGGLLVPPMLAEALVDPSPLSRLTSVSLPALARVWGKGGRRAAWTKLGLGRSALPPEAAPTGAPSAILKASSSPVYASLASVAKAYLPFIDQHRSESATLILNSGRPVGRVVSSAGSARAFLEVARQVPTLAIGRSTVAVWHPVGQSGAVGWNSGPSPWLAVSSAVPAARLPAVYAAIEASLIPPQGHRRANFGR